MVQAIASELALKGRRTIKSRGTGEEHWRTDFLGKPGDGEIHELEPQAFLIEMSANEVIVPHFHEVDQFQVFVSGSGTIGRNKESGQPLLVHYADHHTGYGPIAAGPQGYSYFTLRAKSDPGAIYLHNPGYREKLKPSAKRHGVAAGITLSTEPVLMDRKDVQVEPLMQELSTGDGLGAALIRMGPDTTYAGPDPSATGGQYYLVLNGSVEVEAGRYGAWTPIFVPRSDRAIRLRAGSKGAEALLLSFANRESA
jgi:hypothetical protein